MATATKKQSSTEPYTEGIGRRKTSVARVRIYERGTGITVNDKDYHDYFPGASLHHIVEEALKKTDLHQQKKVSVHVSGGGLYAQAEAIRHGLARALVLLHEDLKKPLRDLGFLTRDSRMKERKKFGLRSARRAPQWSKR
ncbi:MAG: 30S ribosomal protein S9 [Candidatus Ryanbacteria bacterium CG10_big_fil_rev_8_21_14_0_10_43_42]|uniref:Small ribosomal subunit protein uS9 n=1 Tax=Candidatus Ryanbacteria bacterium CG10_big_fil_rev_8_21_14_0_10_43_42 TaxID=1974864 RepID=A0A2M8KX29_9BACT|nr:MAG: 30S ribosomal protein S9 [Candidatus Ryanbacteria bacterium CG10_big_fil_rev_8_21_14_0_10_43_42]